MTKFSVVLLVCLLPFLKGLQGCINGLDWFGKPCVHGGFTPFGPFSPCSATCGAGTQTQSRTCTNPAPVGRGKVCVGVLTQERNCNLRDCKVNGGFTPYGDFSACSVTCGDGKQTRSRTCTNPAPSGGGNDCVGALTQTQSCKLIDCKVNGGFTPYGDFSACSVTCGDGKQTRSRTCTNPAPSGGGNDCVGALTQTQSCKLIDCKVDGGFTPYGDFSACSATCGDGTQTKSRTCTNPAPSGGGNDCVGALTQTQSCKLIDCKVDGGFSEWSLFSACSATCGDSYKSRERTCTNPVPSGGGKGCVGDFSEKEKCASDRCSGFDFQWNLLAKEACFQGKDDMPAQVQINQDGTLVGIKLVYVNGRIRCHSSFTGSNFGCFTDQRYFNLAITDNNKAVLFPSPNQAVSGFFADGYKNYQYPGYLPTDKEVVFINNNYPTFFRKGDFISIWNYEDLLNNSEGDNSGKVCVDVYAAFV